VISSIISSDSERSGVRLIHFVHFIQGSGRIRVAALRTFVPSLAATALIVQSFYEKRTVNLPLIATEGISAVLSTEIPPL